MTYGLLIIAAIIALVFVLVAAEASFPLRHDPDDFIPPAREREDDPV